MCSLYDDAYDPADDHPVYNYEADEAADRAEEEAWLNRLPWLTARERDTVNRHPAYPDGMGGDADYDAFALELRRSYSRRVECQFDLGHARVRGAVDLVTGSTYLMDEGAYTLAEELPEYVNVIFADEPATALRGVEVLNGFINLNPPCSYHKPERATLSEILTNRPRVSAYDLQRVVEHLEKAGKLPPVVASVNGKRHGTFHPL
jgi:hypothetical protein